jgi:hypothetical protein
MNKVRFGCYGALIALGVGAFGCSDDDEPRSEVDAGVDASSSGGEGGSGGDGDGGSGGGTGGGGAGGGGTGGAATGGSGGAVPEAGPDAPGDATADADDLSDLPAPTGVLVAAATDFVAGTTEISTVDLATNAVIGNFTVSDFDAVPVADGQRGFVLERSNGVLHILDQNGESEWAVDLKAMPSGGDAGAGDAGTGDAGTDAGDAGPVTPSPVNPHDVVVVPGNGGSSMGYVSLYDANAIAVVNLDTGAIVTRIDLSSFVASGDADGHAEVDSGYYDATTGRVYFTLHRLDLTTSVEETSYMPVCSDVKSLLVGVDPATNAVVDINGVAAGVAVELALAGPADLVWDAAGSRLLLAANGCYDPADGGTGRARHGIEAVTLSSGNASVLYAPSSPDFLSRVIPVSADELIVESIEPEFFATEHRPWGIGDAALGALLAGVPNFPVSDTEESLIGITTPVGGLGNVTRYRIANGASVDLLENVWTVEPGYVAGVVRVSP